MVSAYLSLVNRELVYKRLLESLLRSVMIQFKDGTYSMEHICQMMVGPLKIMSKYWVLFSLAEDCEVIYCPNPSNETKL